MYICTYHRVCWVEVNDCLVMSLLGPVSDSVCLRLMSSGVVVVFVVSMRTKECLLLGNNSIWGETIEVGV